MGEDVQDYQYHKGTSRGVCCLALKIILGWFFNLDFHLRLLSLYAYHGLDIRRHGNLNAQLLRTEIRSAGKLAYT